MPYPTEITPEVLTKLEHIPTSQVKQDLAEARAEFSQKETDMTAQAMIANNHRGDQTGKMAYFRQMAHEQACEELREQIAFLEKLLAKREELENAK